MSYFKKEQIQQANSVNLIEYAKQSGYTLEKNGRKALHAKGHEGLYFYLDNNKYYHFSTDKGGGTIDFIMQFEYKTFTQAVETLIGNTDINISTPKTKYRPPPPKGELKLPPKAPNYKRVYWYLVNVRGIDKEIVSNLMNEKKIYQQADRGNCVFTSSDKKGKPRYATLRGTYPEKKFAMDLEDSDKSYPFHIKGRSDKVYVFESPIDAMSHATITKMKGGDYTEDHRISLGGVTDLGLERFIKENANIEKITLCLDNDKAGCFCMEKIIKKHKDNYEIKIEITRKKDFNEYLQELRKREKSEIIESQMAEEEECEM